MNLDTHSNTSLWKDRAVVELNLAVQHTFQVRSLLQICDAAVAGTSQRFFPLDLK